jgi:ABC-type multidrug transport system permease subunit
MRTLAVARKSLVEWLREPQLLALIVFAPLAFLVATIVSYPRPFLVTHTLFVINATSQGQDLLDDIKGLRHPDGRPAFTVTEIADPAEGEAALRDKSAAALLTIAPGDADIPGAPVLNIMLRGDALNSRFYEADALLASAIQRHADRLAGQAEIVRLLEKPIPIGENRTLASPQYEYDLYVPGMIIFGILLFIPQTAMLLGREVRAGTLRRLSLTRLSAGELLIGVTITQLALAVLVTLVIFWSALAMGFHNQGSLGLAVTAALVVGFSAIGQGLIVACFVANDSQAVNYGAVVTMLQVFVSGAFFPMPASALLSVAGHEMSFFDLVPATHGMLTLQQVLSYGAGWNEVGFRLIVMLGLSLVYFALGVAVFRRLQMR